MTEENNNNFANNDAVSVTLDNKVANEHKNLRAFFVSFASSKEEAQAIAEGQASASGFVPLYAESEQSAWAFLQEQINNGLIVTGFEPLEVLEMKVFMLRSLAEKSEINIQRKKMFDGRLLLIDHAPVQIYDAPTKPEGAEENVVVDAVVPSDIQESLKTQDTPSV